MTASSSDGKDVHLFVARAADLDAWMSPDADKALPYTVITSIDADAGRLASRDETHVLPAGQRRSPLLPRRPPLSPPPPRRPAALSARRARPRA